MIGLGLSLQNVAVLRTITDVVEVPEPDEAIVAPVEQWQVFGTPTPTTNSGDRTATFTGSGGTNYTGVVIPVIGLTLGDSYRVSITIDASSRVRIGTSPQTEDIKPEQIIFETFGTFTWVFVATAATAYLTLDKTSTTTTTVSAVSAEAVPLEVKWSWTGAPTQDGAVVSHALTESASVRTVVSTNSDMLALVGSTPATTGSSVKQTLTGLQPDTVYYHAPEVNGVVDTTKIGRFRTLPTGPKSFKFALGSCYQPDTTSTVWQRLLAKDPLFFLGMGDSPYLDDKWKYDGWMQSQCSYSNIYDLFFSNPGPAEVYRKIPVMHMWSDHDFGDTECNDGRYGYNVSEAAKQRSLDFARKRWPNPPTWSSNASDPVGYSIVVGRMRLIVPDLRSAMTNKDAADSTNKTKMGAGQKAWVKAEMTAAKAAGQFVVLFVELPFIGTTDNETWYGYATERREIMDHAEATGLGNGQFSLIAGDMHGIAIDDGTNTKQYSTSGTFVVPLFHAAALDYSTSTKGGPYSKGAKAGTGQFGMFNVTENADGSVTILWEGIGSDNSVVMSHTFTISAAQFAGTEPEPEPEPDPEPEPSGAAVRQQALYSGRTDSAQSLAFPSEPLSGSVILLLASSDKSKTNVSTVPSLSGWNRLPAMDSDSPVSAVFWKVSDGSNAPVTPPTTGSSLYGQYTMVEVAGVKPAISYAVKSDYATVGRSKSASATAAAAGVAVAVSMIDSLNSLAGSSARSWSDGFVERAELGYVTAVAGDGSPPAVSIAAKNVAAGAVSTTFNYSGGSTDEIGVWLFGFAAA